MDTLKLSRFFMSLTTCQHALHAIDARKYHFNPADLIQLCREFNTRSLFMVAFQRLVDKKLYEITEADVLKMGNTVFIAIAQLRDVLEEHRHIVATEPPMIAKHVEDCNNPVRCAQDWYAIWWNGMGRFLLDGRCTLTFEEAFKCFEGLQFGQMAEGCKSAMLQLVKDSDAFLHGRLYVKEVATRLVNTLIMEDNEEI
jgi:hypothetical protein